MLSTECREVATDTAERVADLGPFRLLTRGDELPVFAFTLHDEITNFTVFDVSAGLRERGWQVPAYTFPENRTDLAALRVVIRNGTGARWPTCCSTTWHGCCRSCTSRPRPREGPESAGFDHASAQHRTT